MRKLLLPLLIVSLLATVPTCRQRSSDVVTVAMPEKFTAFDTLTMTGSDSAAERMKNLMFNSLVKKNEKFEYVGELAKDITTEPDGVTVTFVLPDGVKFHNGSVFSSADVKYTFDELFKANGYKAGAFFDTVPLDQKNGKAPAPNTSDSVPPANAETKPSGGAKPAEVKTKRVPHIVSLETPDAQTVVFRMARPALVNQLLSNLVAIPIIPLGSAAQQKEQPVGSGPFKFVSFDASQSIVELEANSDYWEGAPKIAKLRVKTVVDAGSLQAELQTGAVDIAPNPSNLQPDMIKSMGSSPNLRVEQFDGSNVQYVVFNIQKPPLNNVKVRQAIGYAVDRERIVSELLFNQARTANSVIPPESWAYTPGVQYRYDPDRARQLLAEAGYFGDEVVFKYSSGSAYVNNYSQVVHNALTSVGINVRIETQERNTIVDQLAKGQVQMFTGIWVGGNQDPIFLRDLFSSTKIPIPSVVSCCNRSRYQNDEVDRIVEEAVNAVDKAAAKDLYARTWDLVSNDLPLLPLWYPANIVVCNKRIGNVKMSGSGDWGFLKDITVNN